MRKILIGLVGHPSSGKDTIAAHLVDKYNFTHISTGDLVRSYIAEQKLGEADRKTMNFVSTNLREKNGADYLVRLALENDSPLLVVSGMRAVAEAQAIKDNGGVILACSAPIKFRYERAVERGRIGDGVDFEKFKEQEEAELSNSKPEAPNVSAVIAMADHTVNNIGSIDDLCQETDKLIKKLLQGA